MSDTTGRTFDTMFSFDELVLASLTESVTSCSVKPILPSSRTRPSVPSAFFSHCFATL